MGEDFGLQAQVLLQLQLLHRLAVILGDDLGHCRGERGLGGGPALARGVRATAGASAQPPPMDGDAHVPAIRLQLPVLHHCLWLHWFTRLGGAGGTGKLPAAPSPARWGAAR